MCDVVFKSIGCDEFSIDLITGYNCLQWGHIISAKGSCYDTILKCKGLIENKEDAKATSDTPMSHASIAWAQCVQKLQHQSR